MSTPRPDEDGKWRGIGGLAVQGALFPNGKPRVIGQWGLAGFGYTTDSMRQAAAAIVAACDQADAMAAKEGTDG